ncbi:MAG: ABC transporter permease [Erysipelotrichaceae bacterium]|jgi:simple sugar transport system permease protein|nr:ABC transporter permease [Erysipelotrichaceae bacterium]
MNLSYLTTVANSTLRMMTPVLYVTLAAAVCSKVKILNISMEGVMLISAFFAIVTNWFTHNVFLSIITAIAIGVVVSAVVGFCIIYLKAQPVVVGMACNTMMSGLSIYLLYAIFHTRGVFTDPSLQGIPKINLPFIKDIPVLGQVLYNLTIVDYLAFASAIVLYIFLYKTVLGYRLRAIGINPQAAQSLGTKVERYQFLTVTLSGILSGLGGSLLSMGSVTLFIQNISSGRGYIAMAANNLGRSHPLGALLSSFFFGFCQSLGYILQGTSIKSQITTAIPYVATILALILFTVYGRIQKARRISRLRKEEPRETPASL